MSLFFTEAGLIEMLKAFKGTNPTTPVTHIGAYDAGTALTSVTGANSTDLFFMTLTTVRSSFATPVPREDLYTLARKLTNAVEKLTSAAHILYLHKIDGFAPHITAILDIIQRQAVLTEAVIPKLADIKGLDNYWMDMLRISRQAVRTAEEYDAELAERFPMERYRRYTKFIAQLVEAANAMRGVSSEIGRIIVQES